MIIASVFKKSTMFPVEYVNVFSNVFSKYHPDIRQVCFTDCSESLLPKRIEKIPFAHSWANDWWTKLELFRPDINEDIFYVDLDNLILHNLDLFFDSFKQEEQLLIKDLDPKKERFQTAVMWIPQSKKHLVWDPFIKDPNKHIKEANIYGDAAIIRKYWTPENGTKTFQKVYGNECVASYNLQWNRGLIKNKQDVKILCFHGKTRKPMTHQKDPIVQENFSCYL